MICFERLDNGDNVLRFFHSPNGQGILGPEQAHQRAQHWVKVNGVGLKEIDFYPDHVCFGYPQIYRAINSRTQT